LAPTEWGDYIFWNGTQWTTGKNEVNLGANAALGATGPTDYVALGHNAMLTTTSGDGQVVIGANAAPSAANKSVAIGFNAAMAGIGSHSIYIGSPATSTPEVNPVPNNAIFLNGTPNPMVIGGVSTLGGLYIQPVRPLPNTQPTYGSPILVFNTTTGEFTYNSQIVTDASNNTAALTAITYDTGLVTTNVASPLIVGTNASPKQLTVYGNETVSGYLQPGQIYDVSGSPGTSGQVLSSDVSGHPKWIPNGGVAFSYNIYVSNVSGSDTTGNGQIGNPYQTIAKAVTVASLIAETNPVIINLACGTYAEDVVVSRNNTYIVGGSTSLSSATKVNGSVTFDLTGSALSIIVGGISSLQIYRFVVTNVSANSQSLVITDCIIAPGVSGLNCVLATDSSVGGNCDITIQNSVMYILDTVGVSLQSVTASLINTQITTNPLVGNVNVSFIVTTGTGRLNLFGASLIQPSTSSGVAPIVDFQNTTATPNTMVFNSSILQYTSTTSDAGSLGKACVRFSNGAGITMGVSATNPSLSIYGCFLSAEGATTTNGIIGQIVAIQKAAGGGTAYLRFGTNNMCGSTANHISQNITRSAWVALTA